MINGKLFTLLCTDGIGNSYESNTFTLLDRVSIDPRYTPSILSKVIWWIEDPITI